MDTELELYRLEQMARLGQNKAIISKLKKQLAQLEEENRLLEEALNIDKYPFVSSKIENE